MDLSTIDLSRVPLLLAMLSTIQVAAYSLMTVIKWRWLARLGVSEEDRRLIFSARRSGFDLEQLLARYDEKALRMADSFCRKGHHVFTGLLYILVVERVIADPGLMVVTIVLQGTINLLMLLAVYRSDRVFGPGGLIFGGVARIRDGAAARANLVVANISLLAQYLVVSAIALTYLLPMTGDALLIDLVSFAYLPMVIGDAAGEIIGGTWGRQNIRVRGLGEINKKSWLGTAAVMLGSFFAVLNHIVSTGLAWEFVGLAAVISIVTMFVELAAPRSTDNFAIPFANLLCLLAWFSFFGVP